MSSQNSFRHAATRLAQAVDQSIQMVGHVRGHIDTLTYEVQRDSSAIAHESRMFASSVSHRFLLAKRGVAASPKALRITAQLLAIALRYRLEEGRQQVGGPGREARLQALHASCAKSARAICEENRGATLKLGQFLSMRPDLLPDAYIRELSTLRDRVPALPYEDIEAQLVESLGAPVEEHFAEVTSEAVAAASLAQVHRATGADGRDYAIKVQVPQAEAQVMSDIAILKAVAAALPENSLPFDVRTTLEQIAHSVHQELDYQREAEHCETLRTLLSEMPGVIVPRVIPALSTTRVLTMEWMQGVPLDQALENADSERRRLILTRLVQCFARQIFDYGHFHADPHSGNILVQDAPSHPDGFGLVLLDFGCVQELTCEIRLAYASLLKAVFTGQRDGVRQALDVLGFSQEGNDHAAMEAMVEAVIAPLQKEGAIAEWARDPQAATRALMQVTEAVPGLKAPHHFILLGRVLATLGGILIENADAGVSLPAIIATALARAQASSSQR